MSKLSDVYISALDFFAVILPGAIATAASIRFAALSIPVALIAQPWGESTLWGAFLVVAYLVGHLVYLIGSRIDPLFHKWREKYRGNVRTAGTPYACAEEIRNGLLTDTERLAVNTFQWSRSVLMLHFPAGASDVFRLEADSKFFRSMVVICAAMAIGFLTEMRVLGGLVFMALGVACGLRYGERRLKSEKQAYMHIVALHGIGLLVGAAKAGGTSQQ